MSLAPQQASVPAVFGGAGILACHRIREWRDILVPPERIRVCSGGKDATTRRLDDRQECLPHQDTCLPRLSSIPLASFSASSHSIPKKYAVKLPRSGVIPRVPY